MPFTQRMLLKLALKIRENLADKGSSNREFPSDYLVTQTEHLIFYQYQVEDYLSKLQKARDHNWTNCIPGLVRKLQTTLNSTQEKLTRCIQRIANESKPSPKTQLPDVRLLMDEISALEKEFGEGKVSWKREACVLSVTTEDITLEDENGNDVELGPFAIKLLLNNLSDRDGYRCFRIEALEPNPAAENDSVTHPHVSDEYLCPGRGEEGISLALEQGRIFDCFVLIHAILQTYNPSNPHVPLERWAGEQCDDCGCTVGGTLYECNNCDYSICRYCCQGCNRCRESYCGNCIESCDCCERSCCSGCLNESEVNNNGSQFCSKCLIRCPTCSRNFVRDDIGDEYGNCIDCAETNKQNSEQEEDEEDVEETEEVEAELPTGEPDGNSPPVLA